MFIQKKTVIESHSEKALKNENLHTLNKVTVCKTLPIPGVVRNKVKESRILVFISYKELYNQIVLNALIYNFYIALNTLNYMKWIDLLYDLTDLLCKST